MQKRVYYRGSCALRASLPELLYHLVHTQSVSHVYTLHTHVQVLRARGGSHVRVVAGARARAAHNADGTEPEIMTAMYVDCRMKKY